jgi:V/A-type H+-transporting ATPase subunit F
MSIYVIGDENTVLSFGLVGVEGEVVDSVQAAGEALDRVLTRGDISIALVTENWASQMRARMNRLQRTAIQPIVLEIPGSDTDFPRELLTDLIQGAIGVHLEL